MKTAKRVKYWLRAWVRSDIAKTLGGACEMCLIRETWRVRLECQRVKSEREYAKRMAGGYQQENINDT